jgi:hypothetical protein
MTEASHNSASASVARLPLIPWLSSRLDVSSLFSDPISGLRRIGGATALCLLTALFISSDPPYSTLGGEDVTERG